MPYWKDFSGKRQARCPRRPMFENPGWFSQLTLVYNHYRAGFLPHGGGLFDQHCLFPEIMHWMTVYLNHFEEIAAGLNTPDPEDNPIILEGDET